MSLRQQQIAVFLVTVIIIFGLFAGGFWIITNRLTAEASLQTSLVLARQVEIALADSLRQHALAARSQPAAQESGSFWDFLGRLFPGNPKDKRAKPPPKPPRTPEIRGLMRAFMDRSSEIEAMWVLNSEGRVLYSSRSGEEGQTLDDPQMQENLRRGVTTILPRQQGERSYYDILVPLEMPKGVQGPGGLRLWINPASLTELLEGIEEQLTILLIAAGVVAFGAAFLTTALYTRRFRIVREALRQAEAGTYQARPNYRSRDEVGASLDLIDRLVMKQRGASATAGPAQRMSVAARTLAHEVKNPLNAMAIHLELLKNAAQKSDSPEVPPESLSVLETSVRQINQLVRDFTDYAAPVVMEKKPIDAAKILEESLDAVKSQCSAQNVALQVATPPAPWRLEGDATRLRQAFDNLLRNALEAQPNGGAIKVTGERNGAKITLDFADEGPGVPPERRSSLFEFGHSTKKGGSGIGLALSQLIMEAHGGSLEYHDGNHAGRGATFRITLPLQREDA
ncbi:MAG TPA: HAMP domain-containing sensor histidine kinase [Candidatus Acidoferrales bacterium]|nr:HAMP domain-containing sensor histidine kinase [Candidatus Acidoferrales bacterium]